MYSYRKIYEESNGALYVCNWQLQTCENVLTQSYRVIWEIEGLFGFLLVETSEFRAYTIIEGRLYLARESRYWIDTLLESRAQA